MATSPTSARQHIDVDNAHVRQLLDQRNMRADIPSPSPHTRYSIFSDRSDSPSLYSYFDTNNYRNQSTSPIPHVPRFHDNHFYNDNNSIYASPPLSQGHPYQQHNQHQLSSKQRLADPNASSLDLTADEDAYSDSSHGLIDHDEQSESNLVPASDEDPDTRLSLMGPRMRVHSRAPWEEGGDDPGLDSESDDGMNDNLSIFGGSGAGKRAAVMRGLGFGGKGVAPRPSFDSIIPNKVKRSFESSNSGHANVSTPKPAIQTLAQASVSSTSLALGPSPSSSRLPHKLSMGRLVNIRDRSPSGSSSAVTPDRSYLSAPFTSPLASSAQSADDDSPVSLSHHMENAQQYSVAMSRTRSPSPIPEGDGNYSHHPYANPAHASKQSSDTTPHITRRDLSQDDDAHSLMTRNDTASTFTASEETVIPSHSSSIASVSATTSSLNASTPATSDFSLISAASQPELLRFTSNDAGADKSRKDKFVRRETKLGPISGPAFIGSNFPANKPYNLISLGEAQARVKERNRSATTGGTPPTFNVFDIQTERGTPRPRAASATTQRLPIITFGSDGAHGDDLLASAATSNSSKLSSPVGPPSARTVKNKRSGFMKLFNGREKDRPNQEVPPLPVAPVQSIIAPEEVPPFDQPTPRAPKISTPHRIPVPPIPSSPKQAEAPESRSRKPAPALTIKVSSPPTPFTHGLEAHPRRSDSPKGSNKTNPLQIPVSAPAGITQFPSLRLRPVSGFFSSNFGDHLLSDDSPSSPRGDAFYLLSPSTVSSNDPIPSPVHTGGFFSEHCDPATAAASGDNPEATIGALKEQIRTYRKVWQRQIWELEGQVRDLKTEIEDMKSGDVCEACGRGESGVGPDWNLSTASGVMHRPRAKTGHGARFASGNDP